ncbi:ATP-binding protein [Paractinoplanes atraurantiacus]|uniref:ATP-binding protein n=1 Tax=Paractinoplanes atraurantiacus TaxID=1036182 RepID=UPI0015CF1130|nr:AAA family ATPase [Actinoplanes atraurantiacus]
MTPFIGRGEPLARLLAAHRACRRGTHPRRAELALVTGEAGIGKTALLSRFTAEVGQVLWGTCWDDERAPAWWPWTQALSSLPTSDDPRLAAVRGGPAPPASDSPAAVFAAVSALLDAEARSGPPVVVLDDLQWADPSSISLLRFLARQARGGPLLLIGAYRPDELPPAAATELADLATAAEPIALTGLSPSDVADLVRAVSGPAAAARWAPVVHERSAGHPFFARELCRLLESGGAPDDVPAAVREAIGRRLARLTADCARLLDAAAVAGPELRPDVLADMLDEPPAAIGAATAHAAAAGVLTGSPAKFAHDLYRETVYARIEVGRRAELHERAGWALLRRKERGGPVFAAELARHFAVAVGRCEAGPAVTWAIAAAAEDGSRYAFAEAAGHLRRARTAVDGAGCRLSVGERVGLLTGEAEMRLRAGETDAARELLAEAWTRAGGDGDLLGRVALGLDAIGARFAMPRTELIAALETARAALDGRGTPAEAQVTAALARQLQHSVPGDRPRAGPYAERAVLIARRLGDPATLAGCLLARHDTLWTPGTGGERAGIAAEIAHAARQAGDEERHAQALLLSANAHLENGSAAFRAAFAEYAYVTERLRQPRHDYFLRIRRAALALLDGDLDGGERLVEEAAALGEAVGDSDTGNVRMSQRLEVVRARGNPDELRRTADEAVRWWIGAPAHAHAVAAGFRARAGDLAGARREADIVLALPDWRADRSYLWSVFAGELAVSAIALNDRPLCELLLADLLPLAGCCAVNGALVCFMGAHDHRIGLLQAALGDVAAARRSLSAAYAVHTRLGARLWARESSRALPPDAALRRRGDLWELHYQGHDAVLRDAKGLHDLAVLLGRPGAGVPAVELAAAGRPVVHDRIAEEPVLDRAAVTAYRKRLGESVDDQEKRQLVAELRRATRPGGGVRPLGPDNAERARKAVTARIRDAIKRIEVVLPAFGRHLDRTVHTGHLCRYEPDRFGQC